MEASSVCSGSVRATVVAAKLVDAIYAEGMGSWNDDCAGEALCMTSGELGRLPVGLL